MKSLLSQAVFAVFWPPLSSLRFVWEYMLEDSPQVQPCWMVCLVGSAQFVVAGYLPWPRSWGWRLILCLSALCYPVPRQRDPHQIRVALPDYRIIRNQSVYLINDSVSGRDGEKLAERSVIQVQLCRVQTPSSCCQTPLALLWQFALFPMLRVHFSEGMNIESLPQALSSRVWPRTTF